MTKVIIYTLLLVSLLSSCMCFDRSNLPEITNKQPEKKPSIAMEVGNFKQYYNSKIDDRGIISNKKMGLNCLTGILEPWKNSKLISNYKKLSDYKKIPNYTMTINGSIYQEASPTLNIFSAVTIFIIPSYNTTTFDLILELKNNNTGQTYTSRLYSSFTIWKELIFLPLFPLFWSDMDYGRMKKSMFLYNEFKKQDAF